MPAPAPADCGGRLRVALVANGAQTPALPTPSNATGSTICQAETSGVITRLNQNSEAEKSSSPVTVIVRGCTVSTRRPTTGARAPDSTAIGMKSRADFVGV